MFFLNKTYQTTWPTFPKRLLGNSSPRPREAMCGCKAKVCQDMNCILELRMSLSSCNYRSESIRSEKPWRHEWPARRQPKHRASQIPQQWSENLGKTSWTIQLCNIISTRIKPKEREKVQQKLQKHLPVQSRREENQLIKTLPKCHFWGNRLL